MRNSQTGDSQSQTIKTLAPDERIDWFASISFFISCGISYGQNSKKKSEDEPRIIYSSTYLNMTLLLSCFKESMLRESAGKHLKLRFCDICFS
jgi:hypothetical protein